jgi:hypothetical protein
MSHTDDLLEWTDEFPTLHDLDGRGGRPGCEYLYCDSSHEREAQQAGWRRKGPVFQLTGTLGSCPFVVMERGEAALGIPPERATQPLYVSQYLLETTGIDSPMTAAEEPTVPVQPRGEASHPTAVSHLTEGLTTSPSPVA